MYWQHDTLNAIVESGPYTVKYSEELYSNWELKYKYNFILNGVVHSYLKEKLKIHNSSKTTLCPIQSMAEYKLPTQKNNLQKQFSTHGIKGGDILKSQLLKECMNTSKLIQTFNLMQKCLPKKRKRSLEQPSETHKKRHKRSKNVSSHSATKLLAKTKKHHSSTSSSNKDTSSSSSSTTCSSSSSS